MISVKKIFLGMTVGLSLLAWNTEAQITVRVRPPRPHVTIVTRPPAPTPRHVWVEEDWQYRGGRYEHNGGYWAAPPRHGHYRHYRQGRWEHRRGGYIWVGGRWQR